MRRFALVVVMLSLALTVSLRIGDAAEPMRLAVLATKAREARIAGNTAEWLFYGRRALALAPEHQDLMFSVARAEAASGNVEASRAS
jgi:hypothetical protein